MPGNKSEAQCCMNSCMVHMASASARSSRMVKAVLEFGNIAKTAT